MPERHLPDLKPRSGICCLLTVQALALGTAAHCRLHTSCVQLSSLVGGASLQGAVQAPYLKGA